MKSEEDYTYDEYVDSYSDDAEVDRTIEKVNTENDVQSYGCIMQHKYSVSIPKNAMVQLIARNEKLSRTDHRVLWLLMAKLVGYSKSSVSRKARVNTFTTVSAEQIGEQLAIPVKKVKKALKHLCEQGVIEMGTDAVTTNGFRFTF
jgi:predicted transcriptional regulator